MDLDEEVNDFILSLRVCLCRTVELDLSGGHSSEKAMKLCVMGYGALRIYTIPS